MAPRTSPTMPGRWTAAMLLLLVGLVFGLMSCSKALAERARRETSKNATPGVRCEVVFNGRAFSPECFGGDER